MSLTREEIIIKDQDELIRVVTQELESPFNEGKKMSQVCLELGLKDTVNLIDERTVQLYELYEAYKNSFQLVNKKIFLDALVIFNQMQPRIL